MEIWDFKVNKEVRSVKKIEVLGTGCAKCKKLRKNVEKAVKEVGSNAAVVKVESLDKIMEYGVMMTPALVVDNEVKVTGRVPGVDEIKELIK